MVVGEYVWGIGRGADDVLSLEFGLPHLVIQEPLPLGQDATPTLVDVLGRRVVGACREMAAVRRRWRLGCRDRIAGNLTVDTDPARADAALRQLDGQRLTSVDYLYGTTSWHLRFDLGGSLSINRSTPLYDAKKKISV